MSTSSDTRMAIEYRKGIIQNNISIDTCKECKYVKMVEDKATCTVEIPTTENCNILKIFYT